MANPLVVHTVADTPWADADELRDLVATRAGCSVDLARTPAETRELLPDAEVALAAHFPADLFEVAERLSWVQALSAGVDFFPQEAFAEHGVALTSAAGVHAQPIAEQVLGYMVAFERDFLRAFRQQERSLWVRYSGGELAGQTLCVVGVGAIGTRVAELADAFGMEVVGTKRHPETAPDVLADVRPPGGLDDLLLDADYVVVACPLTEETRGLIGSEQLKRLDEEAVLVNVARGPVVDQDALVAALRGDGLGGAALDVFEEEPLPETSPLWDLPNVLVTPHMAGSTPRSHERIADLFARNYEAWQAGDPLENRVV
ncbi:MAG: D-2-hydroxyacid dehydrogenase [Haloarculaceae archaeon]